MERSVAAALLMERAVRNIYEDKSSSAIQPLQWAILRYMASAATSDARVATIAKYLGLHHAPVSRAVATLVKRGLIEKQPGRSDLRTAPFELTLKGRDLLKVDPILKIASQITLLPEGERSAFERAMRNLALTHDYKAT